MNASSNHRDTIERNMNTSAVHDGMNKNSVTATVSPNESSYVENRTSKRRRASITMGSSTESNPKFEVESEGSEGENAVYTGSNEGGSAAVNGGEDHEENEMVRFKIIAHAVPCKEMN